MQQKRLKLQGFNNLTKTLSFNIYDVNYALSERHQREYIEYIDRTYDAERLTQILSEVAQIIGANILNIAHQDYDPQVGGQHALAHLGAAEELFLHARGEEPRGDIGGSAGCKRHDHANGSRGPRLRELPGLLLRDLDRVRARRRAGAAQLGVEQRRRPTGLRDGRRRAAAGPRAARRPAPASGRARCSACSMTGGTSFR